MRGLYLTHSIASTYRHYIPFPFVLNLILIFCSFFLFFFCIVFCRDCIRRRRPYIKAVTLRCHLSSITVATNSDLNFKSFVWASRKLKRPLIILSEVTILSYWKMASYENTCCQILRKIYEKLLMQACKMKH